jgi:tRNA(adenine34) deaminase
MRSVDQYSDKTYMDMALSEARRAEDAGEVPVGAVIVAPDGRIIGRGFNQPVSLNDPSAHAEIMALREACGLLQNYRLPETTMYCTVEPCVMCAGALVHARITRLVFGASDPKAGAAGSIYNVVGDPRLNHQIDVLPGVREAECRSLLQSFFERRR